ncbi:MAG: hypothetical protein WEA08_03580, partial [Woeseia sp.]
MSARRPVASTLLFLAAGLLLSACSDRASDTAEESAPQTASATESAATSVPTYSAREFYETTSYGMVPSTAKAFAPDGDSLLVSSDETGVFNAYELPLDGGDPVALTSSEDNAIFAVSWFPDDRRILYTWDSGGNELNHVLVLEEDGEHRDLTPGDELKAEFLRWSGDGKSFYLLTTERDQRNFDIYRYNAKDYSRELVFENPGLAVGDISPDGRWVALVEPRTSADSDIYLVDLASNHPEPELITPHDGNISYSVH